MLKKLAIIALVLTSASVSAEYRVYEYVIKARNPFSINQKAYLVTSTLDPQSYLAYHGGASTLKIDLIRTWMCKGDTSKSDYCESPYQQMKRETASQQEDISQSEGV